MALIGPAAGIRNVGRCGDITIATSSDFQEPGSQPPPPTSSPYPRCGSCPQLSGSLLPPASAGPCHWQRLSLPRLPPLPLYPSCYKEFLCLNRALSTLKFVQRLPIPCQ